MACEKRANKRYMETIFIEKECTREGRIYRQEFAEWRDFPAVDQCFRIVDNGRTPAVFYIVLNILQIQFKPEYFF